MIQNNPFVQILIEAIQGRRDVIVNYNDKERLVEPHAIGIDKKDAIIFRAYQPYAYEDSKAGWKLMHIDKVNSVILINKPARDGYRRGDSAMTTVLAQV